MENSANKYLQANVYRHKMVCAQHHPPENSLDIWFLSETEKYFGFSLLGKGTYFGLVTQQPMHM